MGDPFRVLRFISKLLNFIAGVALTFMMLLTVVDVLFRAGGHPLIGAYEIVALAMGIVIGFGIPQTSLGTEAMCTWSSFWRGFLKGAGI